MTRSRVARVAVAGVLAIAAAAAIAWWMGPERAPATTAGGGDASRPIVASASVGGPFELVDQTGLTVTDQTYRGSFTLVYFGFTFCPDVCPTELASMSRAMEILGDGSEQVVPILITIDPERDDVAAMADYVSLFHPRLVGLTGSVQQIADAAESYRVFYAKVEDPDMTYYLMDHSAFVYLMDPDGQNLAVFPPGTQPETMAEEMRRHLPSPAQS